MNGRAGFALPMVILTLALITAAVVAAYSSTSAEVVANSAMRAQDRAYQLAEAGLQQFMLRRGDTGFCTNCVANPLVADSEWTKVSLPSGYANVVAMRVRPRVSEEFPALFFIRSTGVDTTVKMSGAGSAIYATRTVGVYASFGTAAVKVLGAWTSLNGISNNIGAGIRPADGDDECNEMSDVAGVVVPKIGQHQYRPSFLTNLNSRHPDGSPRVDSSRVLDSLKVHAGIDWNAIQNYNAIPADITLSPPYSVGWPTASAFADTSYWPVIRIRPGNFTLPGDGQGILIIDGRLSLTSGNGWDGIVLVGGDVLIAGGSTDEIRGAMITGLNRTLPTAVNPAADEWNDNDIVDFASAKQIRFHSCNVARAAERLKVYFAWPNTWLDNVAIW